MLSIINDSRAWLADSGACDTRRRSRRHIYIAVGGQQSASMARVVGWLNESGLLDLVTRVLPMMITVVPKWVSSRNCILTLP
jgi:hypothetical protein